MMKKFLALIAVAVAVIFNGCTDAEIASYNLATAGDQFELNRRVVFYNGITGEYMLTIEGRLSIQADDKDNQLEVTCKVAEGQFKKHTLGLSDNVTYFCEQLDPVPADVYNYRVIFKPSAIITDVDVE